MGLQNEPLISAVDLTLVVALLYNWIPSNSQIVEVCIGCSFWTVFKEVIIVVQPGCYLG